jgi:hypothetical protein
MLLRVTMKPGLGEAILWALSLVGISMVVPERWQEYNCEDYFASPLAETGYWDEGGQYWYFWRADRILEDHKRQFLVIGSAGVDGIDWGYRKGLRGLWAYYPIDSEFVLLTDTFAELVERWLSGRLTV